MYYARGRLQDDAPECKHTPHAQGKTWKIIAEAGMPVNIENPPTRVQKLANVQGQKRRLDRVKLIKRGCSTAGRDENRIESAAKGCAWRRYETER